MERTLLAPEERSLLYEKFVMRPDAPAEALEDIDVRIRFERLYLRAKVARVYPANDPAFRWLREHTSRRGSPQTLAAVLDAAERTRLERRERRLTQRPIGSWAESNGSRSA
jgi:hypothetical protein